MTWDSFLVHQNELKNIINWEKGIDPSEPIEKQLNSEDFITQLKSGKIDVKEYLRQIVDNRKKKINVSEEEKQREVEAIKKQYANIRKR